MSLMKGGGGCRVISCGWGMPLVWLAKYFMSKKSSYSFRQITDVSLCTMDINRSAGISITLLWSGMKDLQLFRWRQVFYHPSFRHSHNSYPAHLIKKLDHWIMQFQSIYWLISCKLTFFSVMLRWKSFRVLWRFLLNRNMGETQSVLKERCWIGN